MERLFSRKNQLQFSSDAQQFGEVAGGLRVPWSNKFIRVSWNNIHLRCKDFLDSSAVIMWIWELLIKGPPITILILNKEKSCNRGTQITSLESDDTAGVLSFKRTLGQTDAEKMEAVRKTLPVKKTSMSKIKQKKAKKPTGQQMHFTDDGKVLVLNLHCCNCFYLTLFTVNQSATAFEKLASTSAPKKNFKEEYEGNLIILLPYLSPQKAVCTE